MVWMHGKLDAAEKASRTRIMSLTVAYEFYGPESKKAKRDSMLDAAA